MALVGEMQNLHKEVSQPSVTIASASTLQSQMYLSFHRLSKERRSIISALQKENIVLVLMLTFSFMGDLWCCFSVENYGQETWILPVLQNTHGFCVWMTFSIWVLLSR